MLFRTISDSFVLNDSMVASFVVGLVFDSPSMSNSLLICYILDLLKLYFSTGGESDWPGGP